MVSSMLCTYCQSSQIFDNQCICYFFFTLSIICSFLTMMLLMPLRFFSNVELLKNLTNCQSSSYLDNFIFLHFSMYIVFQSIHCQIYAEADSEAIFFLMMILNTKNKPPTTKFSMYIYYCQYDYIIDIFIVAFCSSM